MARRRTNRFMLDRPLAQRQILDCLLFSMAITAIMEDPLAVDLPLKMTPSGGARNPYEAYVCVRNVEGLEPGTYHYSAMERNLAPLPNGRPPAFERLLAGQHWAAKAGALIFLAANFERTMWKYHNASAYRIIMIEAGHIAQNILLAATHHGLVANPHRRLRHQPRGGNPGALGPDPDSRLCPGARPSRSLLRAGRQQSGVAGLVEDRHGLSGLPAGAFVRPMAFRTPHTRSRAWWNW